MKIAVLDASIVCGAAAAIGAAVFSHAALAQTAAAPDGGVRRRRGRGR
jgi:hypothetical protein